MSEHSTVPRFPSTKPLLWSGGLLFMAGAAILWPNHFAGAVGFVFWGLVAVAPIVVPGILLAAWIIASGADAHVARAFEGRTLRTVVAA